MRKITILLCCALLGAAVANAQDRDVVAGIPVNYDETKVGDYKLGLPDPLTFNNGKPVKNLRQWKKRRAEIVKLFEENEYGKWPAKKPALRYDVEQDLGFDGTAVRKQITLYFSPDDKGPRVDVLVYLPKDAVGPSPLLLNLSFFPNSNAVSDPGVKPGRRWNPQTRQLEDIRPMPAMGGMMGGGGGMRFGQDETIKKFLAEKKEGDIDTADVRTIKGLIRRGEARTACTYNNIPLDHVHFLLFPCVCCLIFPHKNILNL